MADSKHNRIAQRLAAQRGVPYNKGKGPDIKGPRQVIEVKSTANEVPKALRQLSGSPKPRYISVPNPEVAKVVKRVQNLKVGVMNEQGKIVKPAQRPKK